MKASLYIYKLPGFHIWKLFGCALYKPYKHWNHVNGHAFTLSSIVVTTLIIYWTFWNQILISGQASFSVVGRHGAVGTLRRFRYGVEHDRADPESKDTSQRRDGTALGCDDPTADLVDSAV
jgi:hypothetical protein